MTPLAQTLLNAYDARDREMLLRAVDRVQEMERAARPTPTRCSHCTGCAMPMRCPVNRADQDAQ